MAAPPRDVAPPGAPRPGQLSPPDSRPDGRATLVAMKTRIWAGLVALLLVLGACSSSDDTSGAVETTLASPSDGSANTASDDPAWDDNTEVAQLVQGCVATRSRLAEYAGVTDAQLANGCLADARVLQAAGCSVVNAARTLLDPNPDLSQGQCPG